MAALILRRLVGALLNLWVVITVVFFSIHLLPGDPVEAALSQSTAPPEVIEERRAALGLDRPLLVQYTDYLAGLFQGNWGVSWSSGQLVESLVLSQLAPTITLALASMLVAVVIGFMCGYGAAAADVWLVRWICDAIIAIALSTPVMLSGLLLIWLFSLILQWLPATGQTGIASLILPSLVVGFSTSGGIAQAVVGSLKSVLPAPYMVTARSKGLTRVQAEVRHGLRSALPAVISLLAVQFGYLAAGAVVAEGIFARQGLGRLMLRSALDHDLPVVQAIVILTATGYLALNLLADIAHVALDPRLRIS